MRMSAKETIAKLRALMQEKKIDVYVIPSADNHQSEYVGEHFKARAFVTGFTGSAGTAVITASEAGLWTDGRYFLQAEQELAGSGVTLFKSGNPGVPSVRDYVAAVLPEGGTLGFDGRLIAMREGCDFADALRAKRGRIEYGQDLVDLVWTDRPKLATEPVFHLAERYSGESTAAKLKRVRAAMHEAGASHHLLTTLDDIAWLFNIRGRDVLYSPLVLAYAIISREKAELFIDASRLPADVTTELEKDDVVFVPYNAIYEAVKLFGKNDVVLLDPERLNYALYQNLPGCVKKVEAMNPTILFKAVKNEVELANIERAHIKDGVACTKLMHWLKTQALTTRITEIGVAEKLETLRREQDGYLWQSFAPICAFKEHAALMHYSATPETDAVLKEGHLFLADTGGNYLEGSTDVTRTIAIGEVSPELKKHFTAVARGMMNLARAKFPYGCKGYNLDVLARQPIWELGIDYKCGTGHGVGYLLNIHEGPSGFRWYSSPSKYEENVLEAGMVITDEPGIYIEGSHGIRIENELVIRKGEATASGQFMHMDAITFVPIDLDAIDPAELSGDEKRYLNRYHKRVYEKLAEHLTDAEREWLQTYTREI